jgi:predicted phosphoribosyltransferase
MSNITRFADRNEAGRMLAYALRHYRGSPDVIVLGLPRGGVPVAFEVAQALEAPLDVFVVRKVSTPGWPELAMGAVASGGTSYVNPGVATEFNVSQSQVEKAIEAASSYVRRLECEYRGNRRSTEELTDRTVILVDDGSATGSTMRAVVAGVRNFWPKRIVVAVPTAPTAVLADLTRLVDEVVCLTSPEPFVAIAAAYEHFTAVSDADVREYLQRARDSRATKCAFIESQLVGSRRLRVRKRCIPSEQWRPFFDGLSRHYQGRPVNVEFRGWRGDVHKVAQGPLLGLTAERAGDHDVIEVMVGDSPEANINHVVQRPVRVEALQIGNGHDNAV